MPPGRSCPTWPAGSSPCTPKGLISPAVSRPWWRPTLSCPVLASMPGIGVPAAAVLLAETLGKTPATGAQPASYAGLAPVTRRPGSSIKGERRLPRRKQKTQESHVRLRLRLPQIRPHQPRLLPAQTRPRQTSGPSRPRPGPPPHPDPERHDPRRSPLRPPTSSTATHHRLTHHIGAPPARGPGPGHVDGLAVPPRGDEVVIPEYKGGTAAYDPSKTYALDELDELGAPPAAQGTSDYVMDRMLEDERVPGTSTTTPACGSSSRTAVPACARTSSRPPAQGGPPGSAPRASRPHPASLPSSSRRSPVSKHSTTHQTPKRKDHPMTDFFVLQVREDVA